MKRRATGVKDAMVKVFSSSDRPFYTTNELVVLVRKIVPEAKTRTIEVMLTRDFIKKEIVFKTPFKTCDFSTGQWWKTIYASLKAFRTKPLKIDTLQPHYKTLRIVPITQSKVKEALEKKEQKKEPAELNSETGESEMSAYEFGSKIIDYIAELKKALNTKDFEMERVLRNAGSEQQDLKNTISGLNKKIAEQNKELEALRTRVKIRPKGQEKTFKLSEVAHIRKT